MVLNDQQHKLYYSLQSWELIFMLASHELPSTLCKLISAKVRQVSISFLLPSNHTHTVYSENLPNCLDWRNSQGSIGSRRYLICFSCISCMAEGHPQPSDGIQWLVFYSVSLYQMPWGSQAVLKSQLFFICVQLLNSVLFVDNFLYLLFRRNPQVRTSGQCRIIRIFSKLTTTKILRSLRSKFWLILMNWGGDGGLTLV